MSRHLAFLVVLLLGACGGSEDGGSDPGPASSLDWAQWAHDPAHSGQSRVVGQPLSRLLADRVYDPFANHAVNSTGGVFIHYPTPLVAGDDVFMMFKTGSASSPVWTQKRLRFGSAGLEERFTFTSDWQPPPGLSWEPVFHAALTAGFLYVPASGGGVFKVDRESGAPVARIDPLGAAPDTFVVGPLAVAPDGSILYNALALDLADPWRREARGSWLVRVTPDDRAIAAAYATLVPGAPAAGAPCEQSFVNGQLPWPPSATAKPETSACGAQRPGVNVAPTVGPDGSVITVSRAHLNSRYAYVVALNPDLTPRWAASLRERLSDGCGSALLPPTGSLGGCRGGARAGVDPATNAPPAGRVLDISSSSPVVAPDGSVLYGAYTRYNYARGHLFHFDAAGRFLNAHDFGWDVTPALRLTGQAYSIVIKDNSYDAGSYCEDARFCPAKQDGPYRLAQLSSQLVPEWYSAPAPDEWCINAPAVDAEGTVFAVNEDGHLYAIRQGGAVRDRILLARAVGAAYTPLAIGGDGRIFALNYGRMFVAGN